MLPDNSLMARPGQMIATTPYLWIISKEFIERGGENDNFRDYPKKRMRYTLNPENQEDAIDLLPLKEEKGQKVGRAIYLVKDDYMLICIGKNTRPKSFTISKDNPNWVHILRRVRLKPNGPDSAKPKRRTRCVRSLIRLAATRSGARRRRGARCASQLTDSILVHATLFGQDQRPAKIITPCVRRSRTCG